MKTILIKESKMIRDEGLIEIDSARWVKDQYEILNLYVHTADDRTVHCFLTARPHYCDRGHIQLNIDGPLNLDYADSFPRYFFTYEEADEHCRRFLKWRLWKERDHHFMLDIGFAKLAALDEHDDAKCKE